MPLLAAGQFRRRSRQARIPLRRTTTATSCSRASAYNASGRGLARGFFGGGGWEHDYPTADRNLTAIVDYITNVRVRVDGSNILDLDDPRIFENPIIYMSEPGFWITHEEEAKNLRDYLLKGGFIIFDDFEGEGHMAQPDGADEGGAARSPLHAARRRLAGVPVVLRHPASGCAASELQRPARFYGMFENNDPTGRMIAIANFNNDLGDYWEWSAEGLYGSDPTNDAYRLGVNYIVYAMTH